MMNDADHIQNENNVNKNDSTDAPVPVSYFITGFGPFGQFTDNPTSAIIDCLLTEKNAHNPKLGNVHMLEVVRVAASDATQQVNLMMERIMDTFKTDGIGSSHISPSTDTIQERVHSAHAVLLHLGVNHQIRNHNGHENKLKPIAFQLEQNAFNEAHFRIPDKDGWKPKHEKITVDKDLGHRLSTDLNVKRIRDRLIQKDFDVFISGDAGRFLCNYIYWESLNKLTADASTTTTNGAGISPAPVRCNVHVLFVHVPTFDCISKDVQVNFVMELIESISESIVCQEGKKRKH
mmetsp:Transcript_5716/g.10827  ORF Transcript_5716/g.10827 Transcript_5716/m.10827 type:complete len:291 (+) Transcript_5716:1819-2691(+)